MNKKQIFPRIYTQRGLIPMEDIIPTDYVYEYNTGRMLTVVATNKRVCHKLLKITFDDGRAQICESNNIIYNPRNISGVKDIIYYLPHNKYPFIPCNEIDFKRKHQKLAPSPYMAGIFLIYGDTKDRYVNVMYGYNANTDWIFEYNLTTTKAIDGWNKTYYACSYHPDKPLHFDTFIPSLMNESHTLHKYIPDNYFYASIQDRWNMIRGIFDVGYNIDRFPDNVGIEHWSENVLAEVKELLLSLGILSKISTDNYSGIAKYRLDIIDNHKMDPKFFYDNKYITHMMNISAKLPRFLVELPRISDISEYIPESTDDPIVITDIVTPTKNSIIIGENFLPILFK